MNDYVMLALAIICLSTFFALLIIIILSATRITRKDTLLRHTSAEQHDRETGPSSHTEKK